jgi:hypothetical protein
MMYTSALAAAQRQPSAEIQGAASQCEPHEGIHELPRLRW